MNNKKYQSLSELVWVILLLEGFISVSLQIVFMRQLSPFLGSDVNVTGLIIGVFLLALSLGYRSGVNKKKPAAVLTKNFILSGLWVAVGCAYLTINTFFGEVVYLSPKIGLSVFYLFVFMFPVVFWLAQTLPLLITFIRKGSSSAKAGNSLSLNTIGSVLGATITPLVLFWAFGVAWTILLMVVGLMVLSLFAYKMDKGVWLSADHLIGVLIIALAFFFNIDHERQNFIKTTAYANYDVKVDSDAYGNERRVLELNKTFASITTDGQATGYVRYLNRYMIEQLGYTDHDVLVLGSGGFTFSINDETKNSYTYLDIDPDIKPIAEKFFLGYNIKGNFVGKDARAYVKTSEDLYDVVFVDLYSNLLSMPWQVTTVEFMEELNDRVSVGGHVFFNMVYQSDFKHDVNRRIHNTITSVFPYCYITPLFSGKQDYMNVVYVCSKPDKEALEINVDDRVLY